MPLFDNFLIELLLTLTMPEEMIPIVNEADEIVDIRPISEVHKKGLIHREAYVYLINLNNLSFP